MEKLCFDESCSCYSCDNTIENGIMLNCKFASKKCSLPLMYEDGQEDNMAIDYRKAVMRAKNCTSYNEKNILHVSHI